MLKIEKTKFGIRVELVDDGDGPQGGKGGLGQEWFNAISGNSWSLKRSKLGGGAILELFITH